MVFSHKTSLKWLTVAMPLLETRERETKEGLERYWIDTREILERY